MAAALQDPAAERAEQAAPAPLWADGTEVLLPGADGDAWVRGAVIGGASSASGGAVASQRLRVRLGFELSGSRSAADVLCSQLGAMRDERHAQVATQRLLEVKPCVHGRVGA